MPIWLHSGEERGGIDYEPCNLVAGNVSLGPFRDGRVLPVHGSLWENLNGGDKDDLSDSGCSGFFICISDILKLNNGLNSISVKARSKFNKETVNDFSFY